MFERELTIDEQQYSEFSARDYVPDFTGWVKNQNSSGHCIDFNCPIDALYEAPNLLMAFYTLRGKKMAAIKTIIEDFKELSVNGSVGIAGIHLCILVEDSIDDVASKLRYIKEISSIVESVDDNTLVEVDSINKNTVIIGGRVALEENNGCYRFILFPRDIKPPYSASIKEAVDYTVSELNKMEAETIEVLATLRSVLETLRSTFGSWLILDRISPHSKELSIIRCERMGLTVDIFNDDAFGKRFSVRYHKECVYDLLPNESLFQSISRSMIEKKDFYDDIASLKKLSEEIGIEMI